MLAAANAQAGAIRRSRSVIYLFPVKSPLFYLLFKLPIICTMYNIDLLE